MMVTKLYGHPQLDADKVEKLIEVSVQTTTQEMRKIAEFLIHAAEAFDTNTAEQLGHLHLSDFNQDELKQDEPELVVVHPDL